jgi:lipopolysaccharide transport system permease protein
MSSAAPAPLSSRLPVTHIRPGTRAVKFTLNEIWHARELLYFLVLRDIKVRYKQTVLGVAWSVLQPFLTMVVFTIFFGRLAGMPSDGVPYPLFSLAAVLPWTYFAAAATNGSSSLVGNQHLLGKVYFPRVLVPLAAILTPAVDLTVSFGMLMVLMAWYHVTPAAGIVALPFFAALGVLTALAVTLWTSALSVRYRDARYVLPFVIQIWLFVTPVAYPASMVPERWRMLYALNPMATVVEGFRGALLGTAGAGAMTPVAVVVVIAGLAGGIAYFRSVEGSIVDLA